MKKYERHHTLLFLLALTLLVSICAGMVRIDIFFKKRGSDFEKEKKIESFLEESGESEIIHKETIKKIIDLRKKSRPENWPEYLWKSCWVGNEDKGDGYIDFTINEWVNLEVDVQMKYAEAYQNWYVQKKGLERSRIFFEGATSMEMMLIPPGKFWMGLEEDKSRKNNDELRHKVLISKAFWLGRYEVIQSQWESVMGNNPSMFKGSNFPVEEVSWGDCKLFCEKLGMLLPSEAQWEYACRGGSTKSFSFGENITTEQVNYNGISSYGDTGKGMNRKRAVEVGSFSGNGWGVYDMHGNVWEWCEDIYGEYSNSEVTDPIRISSDSSNLRRICRGGSWSDNAEHCRSALRGRYDMVKRYHNLGFRVLKVFP